MKELKVILKKGYWIQVSPMASADPEEWILAIYKKGKILSPWHIEKLNKNKKI